MAIPHGKYLEDVDLDLAQQYGPGKTVLSLSERIEATGMVKARAVGWHSPTHGGLRQGAEKRAAAVLATAEGEKQCSLSWIPQLFHDQLDLSIEFKARDEERWMRTTITECGKSKARAVRRQNLQPPSLSSSTSSIHLLVYTRLFPTQLSEIA